MAEGISRQYLAEASEFIASRMGLNFTEARLRDLESGIKGAAQDLGYNDAEEFIKWLISVQLTQSHIETLASHLTVGETYFFREKESFRALETDILPKLISDRRGKRLRVWTAGCSTGEEPYSIAILLKRLISDIQDWQITILATDINSKALKKGADGIYNEWSFRGTPESFKEIYFKAMDKGRYAILPDIKKMVTFQYLNLAKDFYPSLLNHTNAMDIIFCRNVLMYFSPDRANNAINGFHNSLVDNGWLLLGPTDNIKPLPAQFEPVAFPGATLYRKSKHGADKFKLPDNPGLKGWESLSAVHHRQDSSHAESSAIPDLPIPSSHVSSPVAGKAVTEPKELRSQYDSALQMIEDGRYDEAFKNLYDLYSGGQNGPETTSLLARVCANQGRLEDAAYWCNEAISGDMVNPHYHYLLATIDMERGQADEAVNSLKKTLYLDHDFVLAHFMLGNLMQSQGKMGSSIKHLRNASDLLSGFKPDETLPESEGITAGRLSEIIAAMMA